MADLPKNVNIVVCGDRGVGKSSLVFALIGGTFNASVPRLVHTVTHPSILGKPGVLEIHDTSSANAALQEKGHTTQLLRKADVALVVCEPVETSFESVEEFWVPHIRSVSRQTGRPIQIVVAVSKVDTAPSPTPNSSSSTSSTPSTNSTTDQRDSLPAWKGEAYSSLCNHPDVHRIIEVSAKDNESVSTAFCFPEYVALYPQTPLYDSVEGCLTEKCKRALTHIFRLYDRQNRGLLNDDELHQFQKQCFKLVIDTQTVQLLKFTLSHRKSTNISNSEITLEGFIDLHQYLIERNRIHTVWESLRHHNFDDSLHLTSIPFPRKRGPRVLSPEQLDRLTEIFNRFSDQPNRMTQKALESVFCVLAYPPFDSLSYRVQTHSNGDLSLRSWLCLWTLLAYFNPSRACECLRYLGLSPSASRMRQAAADGHARVVHCVLLGDNGVGKTTILKRLVGEDPDCEGENPRGLKACHKLSSSPQAAVKWQSKEYFLIVEEMHRDDHIGDYLTKCDVLLLAYDMTNVNSLHFLEERLRKKKLVHERRVLVGTKADLCGEASREMISLRERVLNSHSLFNSKSFPLHRSADEIHSYFQHVLTYATELREAPRFTRRHFIGVLTLMILVTGCSFCYRSYNRSRSLKDAKNSPRVSYGD